MVCIFGHNAYLNKLHMATPYSNVSGNPNQRSKDNYNFYIHSFVFALSVLLACWPKLGLLQMAVPQNVSLNKFIVMVNTLAKSHNFCINKSEVLEDVPQVSARDMNHVMNNHNGYVKLSEDGHDTAVPLDLMHGSHHFMDVPWVFLYNHQLNDHAEMFPLLIDIGKG